VGGSPVSYRPALTGQAMAQFRDLMVRKDVYRAFMTRLLRLAETPWDAWPVQPGGAEPAFRAAQSGDYGLLLFRRVGGRPDRRARSAVPARGPRPIPCSVQRG
jgi:hypothetical protein